MPQAICKAPAILERMYVAVAQEPVEDRGRQVLGSLCCVLHLPIKFGRLRRRRTVLATVPPLIGSPARILPALALIPLDR